MPILGIDGIQQFDPSQDLLCISAKDIQERLPTDDGNNSWQVVNSSLAKCLEVFSNKNTRVYGNFFVDGTMSVINSEEVYIGDRVMTFNADIEDNTQNDYGGVMVKMVENTPVQVITATDFVNSTATITTDIAGSLSNGDLFYVRGSKFNDGLFKAQTVSPTSIVINASATEYDTKTSLVDESGSSAKISEAIPSFIVWDSGWRMGVFSAGATEDKLTILGYQSIEGGVSFSNLHPNVGCQGAAAAGSGAALVGVYNTPLDYYPGNPTQVQEFAEETNDLIKDIGTVDDGPYTKSGTQSINSAVGSVAVTYGTAFSTQVDKLEVSLEHTGGSGTHYTLQIIANTTSGFTVELSSDTDDANYVLHWEARGS